MAKQRDVQPSNGGGASNGCLNSNNNMKLCAIFFSWVTFFPDLPPPKAMVHTGCQKRMQRCIFAHFGVICGRSGLVEGPGLGGRGLAAEYVQWRSVQYEGETTHQSKPQPDALAPEQPGGHSPAPAPLPPP